MITKLTKKQINKFPKYVNEWTQKGLTTERRSLEDAIIDFGSFQKLILKKENPAPVVILDSPTQCWIAVCAMANLANLSESQVESQVWSQVESQVESQVLSQVDSQVKSQVSSQVDLQVRSQVRSQVWSQVESQVWSQVISQVVSQVDSQVNLQVISQVVSQVSSQVDSQVISQVSSQVDSQVRSQVDLQVWSQVDSQVDSQVRSQIKDFIFPYLNCQFWAGWFSFYEFMKNEIGISFTNEKEYNAFKNCQKYGMVFPLDELCIVCQPPTVIKKNSNGLHCSDGPALSYNGENEIYALNGVSMPKEYVLTSAENISAETVMKEINVEIRRELLRKVGIERLLNDLPHKILDNVGNYQLYSLDLSDELKNCKYLKMVNPSVGCFHLEGLDPSINTVEEALKWRNNNMFVNAEVLT